ncbi:DNA polymerase III subunit delta' [Actibacterium mucosum KCTC 23349]|uniref:DNA polymerase III subunit delta n=1 Tax=Actibacterium mucosum KCTC 23349 TaxID=1454373 RepID=A0A037ZK64_9RHOB|nr:DNA polymerase III subunit delta' [Actibacterium mucosum]KAJ55912.1 DNA polymerase III subunit delta' [Actibacterium mucosum KCTC 23349]
MSSDDIPEPDRIEGAPHPRETTRLFGQDPAQAAFLDAFNSGRLHHGWMITGPKGIGKATFAWRAARFLLTQPLDADDGLFGAPPAPTSLEVDPDHPVATRLRALSEPNLFLLRRAWREKPSPARLQTVITVDEVRRLKEFFALSAAGGGRRVVIADAADEMNVNAANALLKLLEEPPENATIFLIVHQPARLLPTIRSRCRELRLSPLAPGDMAQAMQSAGTETDDSAALATLAAGSVGEAIRLTHQDGLKHYAGLLQLLNSMPNVDRPAALALANSCAGKANEARYDLTLRLLDLLLTRLARAGAGQPPEVEAAQGEIQIFARLCPDIPAARKWAQGATEINARLGHGRAVNLDPSTLILDTVLRMNEMAAELVAR